MNELKGVFMKAVNSWVIKPVQSMQEMELPRYETLQKIADAVLTLGISTLKSPVESQYALVSRPSSIHHKPLS